MIKILLAGTPEFAVDIFEQIIINYNVVAIVSQPDRPSVRGRISLQTPTKLLAQKYNIPCFQPEKIGEIYNELKQLEYDYLITAAFGQFIPTKILSIAKKYNLNIHGSLLPKFRGAAPIQYAVWEGESQTGISLMEMVKEMDAGDVFVQSVVKIDENDTSADVFKKCSNVASENIVEWIRDIDQNKLQKKPQDISKVSFSPKLNKSDGEIKTSMSVQKALQTIKAFYPNPCAFAHIDSKRVKINFATSNPVKNAPTVQLSDGTIYLVDYHFEGKKRVKLK
ncbi:methionyl-tRNA formyltransferase [Mycoplasmopsis californica HAZ160_1]|uniref:Methionyl-tRNA formyltransferase n=1 Tax=Mycoplasmopsis californica HAZ160_1 TaxID=1397850 RepID=A0AAT9F7J4_9BACT|nr:methionyl-tRNA formyltransferase [Mycoplasmopsis californica]BAP00856.1 methionyl-tRNA formyltransferase [Mycoplasmopsis californica HAZ160_1]BBG40712.1 methionyl-tRNA formyltransferase [Mycoplasmopsis californica]BBG41306.1 methionyl-tRNA formyltransferase [Mycoplasmopsis californica]BBG41899.1 methionyl-tRNA formyltransferase [Mycoplasmopsis californica]BBG42492.1 methionyl-tRNA formyltransferase [Mycoplasmopsis californica]